MITVDTLLSQLDDRCGELRRDAIAELVARDAREPRVLRRLELLLEDPSDDPSRIDAALALWFLARSRAGIEVLRDAIDPQGLYRETYDDGGVLRILSGHKPPEHHERARRALAIIEGERS